MGYQKYNTTQAASSNHFFSYDWTKKQVAIRANLLYKQQELTLLQLKSHKKRRKTSYRWTIILVLKRNIMQINVEKDHKNLI